MRICMGVSLYLQGTLTAQVLLFIRAELIWELKWLPGNRRQGNNQLETHQDHWEHSPA